MCYGNRDSLDVTTSMETGVTDDAIRTSSIRQETTL